MKQAIGLLILIGAVGAAQPAAPQAKPAKTAAALPQVESLKFPPLRQVKIPDTTTFTLPNGMRVYLLENHELPLVSGAALVRTGNLFDPADKVGLAGITGTVIRSGGTKTRTPEQLDETLENMAASVESSIGETSGSVSFNALKENTDEVLAIFKDVLTSPAFRQERVDLAKTQTKSAIARRNDNPDSVSDREFASVVYGDDNSYGWDMTFEHVDNIKREDLQKFYERYFFPANIMLSVYGDFDPAEMRKKLENLFADWTVKQAAVPPFPPVQKQADAPGIYQATKTDVTQTFFNVGHLGGLMKDKDYPALSVMSDILGGGFSSRLFTNVRTRKGLAYNVGGGWGANYGHEGLFRIGGSTKSASTVDALEAVRQEIDRIRTEEVTDKELATAKQSVLNSFVFYFDHPRKTLNRQVLYDYWGYPKDFIFQYQKAVEAVTKADVLRVAKQHIQPEQLSIVAVGNPKDFGKPLSALGEVKELDIELPQPKREQTKADPQSTARGRQLMERAQKALGGADKLAAVKDSTSNSKADVTTPQGQMSITQITEWVAPNVLRQTQEFPFGKVITVWDGKSGWLSTPQGVMAMPAPIQQQIRADLFRTPFNMYGNLSDPDRTFNAVGENAVEVTAKSGAAAHIEFDPATGLPARMTYESVAQGAPQKVTAVYSDWRDVDGIKVPFAITIEREGQPFLKAVVTDTKFNTGLSAEVVGKKP